MNEFAKRVADYCRKPTLQYAKKMGFASGLFGSNEQTCDCRLFSSKELTAAWERGKRAAEAARRELVALRSDE